MNVLDNNIRNTLSEIKTLALQDTLRSDTNQTLIAGDVDRVLSGIIVGHADDWVVVRAPIGPVKRILSTATASVAIGAAAVLGGVSYVGSEVEELVDEDDARFSVCEVSLQSRDFKLASQKVMLEQGAHTPQSKSG